MINEELPAKALRRIMKVMEEGSTVKPPNHWRTESAEVHLDHARKHIELYELGDTSEDHIGHAGTRFLMWLEKMIEQQ